MTVRELITVFLSDCITLYKYNKKIDTWEDIEFFHKGENETWEKHLELDLELVQKLKKYLDRQVDSFDIAGYNGINIFLAYKQEAKK